MNKLETVFWDLDGTIADTELFGHRIAFNKAFSSHSLDWHWSKKEYIDLLVYPGGKNRISQYSRIKGLDLSKSLINEIHSTKTNYYKELVISGSIQNRTGVNRLINELMDKRIQQYIVTSSSHKSAETLINSSFDSHRYPFDGLISSDIVNTVKPDPESYLKAIELSGSLPKNCLAIEDSLEGLTAAKSAGLRCLVSLSPWIKEPSSSFFSAELVVDHLGDYNKPNKFFSGSYKASTINFQLLSSLLN
ncbi:HAD-IA family hydrolase [Prochlorococcus sp. MIT 0601]|uniref:HAD-IA family hydrolase n=2 Tax=Prochlorococcus TaxID=1218 RepID=UPI0005338CF4|nr:HAD-IA family hydrolase [Prochlorococcus sp. MIT 0601]KGG12438.1 hypothetical protein EV05_1650 [Prochlorococcus sp. MIT 0601]